MKIIGKDLSLKSSMLFTIFFFILGIISLTLMLTLEQISVALKTILVLILVSSIIISLLCLITVFTSASEPITKKELIIMYLRPSKYYPKKQNIECMICKLEIDKHKMIYTCPYCNSLYHKDHFQQWLNIDTSCPVCNQDFYKYALKTYKKTKN